MKLTTDAIQDDGKFNIRYTCDLDNSSPELRWEEVPEGTAGFALIADDPDAPSGTFVHWVVYNIPANLQHLPAGMPPQDHLPNGIRQGLNSNRKLGYTGPCPPDRDAAHRYFFRLYALRALPELPHRPNAEQLLDAIRDVTIESAEVMGHYQRRRGEAQRAAG